MAGVGGMDYRKFVVNNITGATLWVALFLFAILGRMLVSVLPVFFAFAGATKKPKVK